jgi:hypothetical protein
MLFFAMLFGCGGCGAVKSNPKEMEMEISDH